MSLFTILMGQHNKIDIRPRRKCTQFPIPSPQKTISRLRISMFFRDDTLRSLFATRMSRGLVTVVVRSRFKIIQWLVYYFQKRLHIERIVSTEFYWSTVFYNFHGRPQIFVVQWSKKLSHSKHLLVR